MMRTYARRTRRTHRGMTLLELMGVILILGLLVGVGGVAVMNQIENARVGTAKTQIAEIAKAVNTYIMENNGDLPESLDVLVSSDETARYLDRSTVPLDPWGMPYQYVIMENRWAVISLGKDKAPGGEERAADLADNDKNPAEFLAM